MFLSINQQSYQLLVYLATVDKVLLLKLHSVCERDREIKGVAEWGYVNNTFASELSMLHIITALSSICSCF